MNLQTTDEEYEINLAILEYYANMRAEHQLDNPQPIQIQSDSDSDEEQEDQEIGEFFEQIPDKPSDSEPMEPVKELVFNDPPATENERLLQSVYSKLNSFQKDIIRECIEKKSGGMSCPVGSGKSFISLCLGLYFTKDTPFLIVASKSLIINWVCEIEKFFGKELKYEIIHQDNIKAGIAQWKIKPDTQVILTTADVLAKYYKECAIGPLFIQQKFMHQAGGAYINIYNRPVKPYLVHNIGGGIFYSLVWGCLIIDEAQLYTNIGTQWCQAIGAICSPNRWLLSGTLFDEPKVERILGYYVMANTPNVPRNLPDTKLLLKNKQKFRGLNETMVARKSNLAFTPPKVNEQIISHMLTKEEETVYTMMKNILLQVKKRAQMAKLYKNINELKKFSSYKMVMIMYLRQALICPLIPIASIAIDASDMEKKSELSGIIMDEIKQVGIYDYLNDEKSVCSSRMQAALKCIDNHKDEHVIVFSCFRSFLEILEHYLEDKGRPILSMTSELTVQKRGEIIEKFRNSGNGILLMTYQLGATGLNLQFAATVLLVDFWWNAAKTQQAIGRIFRFGQLAKEINIYMFSANTGIEQILFQKQHAKLEILEELKVGVQTRKVPKLNIDKVIRMIEMADNTKSLQKIKYY
jgi:SNF2 family DNA or RNA helicase